MPSMMEQIRTELDRIEQAEHVKILYACESGSRAWGFPSQDSDYDVRFVYVRPQAWYLSILEKRDVIERPISEMLDIHGWDVKKALNLFRKSNPPLLEWLHSPIVYKEEQAWAQRMRDISPWTFSPKSCVYHYIHMASGNYRGYLQGEQVKIKKYFYVLRPLLACQWIEKYETMPPVEFDQLVDELVPRDSELMDEIQRLLVRKKAGDELDYEPQIHAIDQFLRESIAYYEQNASAMKTAKPIPPDQLDELFRATLQEAWSEVK